MALSSASGTSEGKASEVPRSSAPNALKVGSRVAAWRAGRLPNQGAENPIVRWRIGRQPQTSSLSHLSRVSRRSNRASADAWRTAAINERVETGADREIRSWSRPTDVRRIEPRVSGCSLRAGVALGSELAVVGDGIGDELAQSRRLEGLQYIAVHVAGTARSHGGLHGSAPRDDEAHGVRAHGASVAHELVSAHSGHLDIGDHDVDQLSSEYLRRLEWVGRRAQSPAGSGERPSHPLEHQFVVVNQKDHDRTLAHGSHRLQAFWPASLSMRSRAVLT